MQSHRIRSALDIIASISSVLICALLAFTLIQKYTKTKAPGIDASQHAVKAGLRLGATFSPIPGFNYNQHERSVLFFLNSECSHCIRNLPIYQGLLEEAQKASVPDALLGLFEREAGRLDFVSHGFNIPAKAGLSFSTYGISATPTIVVVDRRGLVENFWVGELSTDAERILRKLLQQRPTNGASS